MTPDEKFELRQSILKEVENHEVPSRKTLELLKDLEEKLDTKIDSSVELLNTKIDNKVSWIVFWSILGLVTSIMAGMFGLLYKEIKDTGEDVKTTSEAVFYIKGTLDKATID